MISPTLVRRETAIAMYVVRVETTAIALGNSVIVHMRTPTARDPVRMLHLFGSQRPP
jgi:hypothetical protein